MNTRYDRTGLLLFLVYLVFYGGFVLTAAWSPEVMDATLGGINLATWYGFGLIAAAFLLAMVYGSMTVKEDETDKQESDSAGQS